MNLAGPGHGGSRYRVKSRAKYGGMHIGVVQQRRGIIWHTFGKVSGETSMDALRDGRVQIESVQREGLPNQRKIVTYL